ncbi:MAG: HEAT repeat domain-containing protein [Eubacteriaceae bacterium]|nr:HEAT repeat domain-containing protein [Eubacteriaceae bacterium]
MKDEQIELILSELEKKETWNDEDLLILDKYSHSKSSMIRNRVAELCAYSNKDNIKSILLRLINDNDNIVRAEAFDSITIAFPNKEIAEILKNKVVNEKDAIARSYAILSWIDVALMLSNNVKSEDINFLENQIKSENDNHCILSYCYGLYLFGKDEYFDKICSFLDSTDYQLRCAVINRLRDIKSVINKNDICNKLIKLLKTEETIAVKDDAERLLKELHFS